MHCSKNMDKLPLGKDELAENGRMGISRKCRRVVGSQQDLSLGDEAIVGEINWRGSYAELGVGKRMMLLDIRYFGRTDSIVETGSDEKVDRGIH